MKVVVGSTNPTKINATRQAFEAVWPERTFEVEGIKVDSGVPDQPMSFDETIRGAKNRARVAMLQSKADFTVGLEGGIEKTSERTLECGWIAVLDRSGTFGIGATPTITVPPSVVAELDAGRELSEVIDAATGRKDVGKQEGFFGVMTRGALGRTEALRDGVIFALARFARPEFYESERRKTSVDGRRGKPA